jgi:ELWxxDGT repeat protein
MGDNNDPKFTLMNGAVYFFSITFNQEEYTPMLLLYKMTPDGSEVILVRRFYHYLNMEDDGQDPLVPELVNVNNALYFFGILNEGEGYKMLKSDGTSQGTVVLKDTHMPTESSEPDLFTTHNGIAFFRSHGRDRRYHSVWRTAGTNENTFVIKEMQYVAGIGRIGNTVFFAGIDMMDNWQLWKTDGTVAGTILLKQLEIGFGYYSGFVDINGTLYFADAAGQLWISNGTSAGTKVLKDFHEIRFIGKGGDRALFTVLTSTGGVELWRSNGTTNGTSKIKTIHSAGGPGISADAPRTTVNNIFYFAANNGVHGYEIWRSDATASGTYMMHDLRKNDVNEYDIQSMVAFRDSLYFCAIADVGEHALYKSDGTSAGTKLISYISPVNGYIPYGDQLLMTMHDIYTTGLPPELWTTNGSAEGTYMVKELNDPDGWAGGYEVINNTVFFSLSGEYLWRTDGTECGTFIVDTPPKPFPMTALGTDLIFGAENTYYGKEPHRLSTLSVPGNPCGDPDMMTASTSTGVSAAGPVVAYSPNPFTDQLVFRINGKVGDAFDVQVNSFTGHVIDQFSAMQTNTDHAVGANWPKGIYVLKVIINGKTETIRVIKK